jgi:mevalonate kinase
MNIGIVMLIILFVLLFLYNAFLNKGSLIEKLENNTTSNNNTGSSGCDSSTLMYKNAGSVQALQDKVNQLMKQVNTLILNDDKQKTDIQNLQVVEKKYDSIAEQADQLANANKQRLLAMVKQAKGKADAATAKSNKLPTP